MALCAAADAAAKRCVSEAIRHVAERACAAAASGSLSAQRLCVGVAPASSWQQAGHPAGHGGGLGQFVSYCAGQAAANDRHNRVRQQRARRSELGRGCPRHLRCVGGSSGADAT